MSYEFFTNTVGLKYEKAINECRHYFADAEMYRQHRLHEGQRYVDFIYGAGETADLAVAKYTRSYPTVTFNNPWDLYVAFARGIVYDLSNKDNPKIVALPFAKFFNYMENADRVPDETADIIDVSEKADGSLGTAFYWRDQWWVSSSGAINSSQAQKATSMLRAKPWISALDKNHCYIFEIIYPQNRIILDYGDTEDLILIGGRRMYPQIEAALTATQALATINGDTKDITVVRNFNQHIMSSQEIPIFVNNYMSDKLVEGVVVTYSDGTRFKFKADEYVKLHALKKTVTFKTTFLSIKEGTFDEFLIDVPEEFRPIVDGWYNEVLDKISRLSHWAAVWWEYVKTHGHSTPGKDLAFFLTQNVPKVVHKYMFHFASGRDITELTFKDYDNFEDTIKWHPTNFQL